MSQEKKRGKNGGEPDYKSAADYYKLKTDAVNDLVTADVSNSPKVSASELRKYHSHWGIQFPEWPKILFIKFWFPGAICFFFIWGLGTYVAHLLDLLFITGMALGIVTDLMINNILRSVTDGSIGYGRWMMFPGKGFLTFFLNILYAYVVLFLVFTLYNVINAALIAVMGITDGTIPLGVEPILFGVFYTLCDTLLIAMKRLCFKIVRDARNR